MIVFAALIRALTRCSAPGRSNKIGCATVAFMALALACLTVPTAALASPPTPAEIDRLRMLADAGRDARALESLLVSARVGNVDAQRAAGEVLLHKPGTRHAADALMWLEAAAAQNDARAMLLLGKTRLFGAPGITVDARAALTWFTRADPKSNPQAAYYIGLIEKNGYGKAVDAVAAAKHLRFAAEREISDAMYLLGNAYAHGEGLDVDPREAMRWYLRAASLEHPQATQELAFAFARGDTLLPQSDYQAENMRRAVEHALRHPKAAP